MENTWTTWQGNEVQVDGRDDAVEFSGILSCMKVVWCGEKRLGGVVWREKVGSLVCLWHH